MSEQKGPSKRALEIVEVTGIMRTEGGRNTMFRILNWTGLDADTFDSDTHRHAMNAGRRQIGIQLRNELQDAAPGEYLQMIKEHTNA